MLGPTKDTHADHCDAPICLESPGITDEAYFWYPDEAICNVRTPNPVSRHVRRVQRRIQRIWRALPPDPGFEDADIGYFTFDDLRRRRVVRSGVRGRNREARS